MKQPTFLEGIAIALITSVVGSIFHTALTPLLDPDSVARLFIAGTSLAYVIYLFKRSREHIGRTVTMTAWLLISCIGWLSALSLTLYLLIHIGLVWLIRSLYLRSGILPALADLGLNGLALAAAFWAAVQTGSVFLTIWCFFLVQALFVFIPTELTQHSSSSSDDRVKEDRFQHAHRIAEAAVRKLSSIN